MERFARSARATSDDECSDDERGGYERHSALEQHEGWTMQKLDSIYMPDRRKWRAWLKRNHRKSPGVWLIY